MLHGRNWNISVNGKNRPVSRMTNGLKGAGRGAETRNSVVSCNEANVKSGHLTQSAAQASAAAEVTQKSEPFNHSDLVLPHGMFPHKFWFLYVSFYFFSFPYSVRMSSPG